jgi:hypothetical protein
VAFWYEAAKPQHFKHEWRSEAPSHPQPAFPVSGCHYHSDGNDGGRNEV